MLKSDLRRLWLRWPPRGEVLKQASRKVAAGEYKNGKPQYLTEHQCAECQNWFPQTRNKSGNLTPDVEVDHIENVGGFSDDITQWGKDLGGMYQRSLVGVEGLRVLCKECHKKKTYGTKEE